MLYYLLQGASNNMRAYGVDRKDQGCCPGHDKFSAECYNSRRSEKAHSKASKISHGRARARFRADLTREITIEEHD